MADFTGTFDFTVPAIANASSLSPSSFTENGVTFTMSVQNTGSGASATYIGFSGTLTVQEAHPTSTADMTFTLGISNKSGFSKFDGPLSIKATDVSGTWQVLNNMKLVGTFTKSNLTVTGTAAGSQIKFINVTSGFGSSNLTLDLISTTVNCFCAGTLVATPDGEVPVETLRPGDRISTADGGTTTVKWLGEQPVNVRLSHPAKVNPICISAGALAEGVPARDLWVSADHAIAIDGMLINAGALVNGSSIYQVRDMPLDGFTYYHVETDSGHELVRAEGVAAESFIDYAGRDSFLNGDEREGAMTIPEMDMPRISDARLVPEAVRDRLADRVDISRAA